MFVKLHIPRLKASARERPEGFVDFVLARGKITGNFVVLDIEALNELNEKFPKPVLDRPRSTPAIPKPPGLGQKSASFATAMTDWAKSGFKTVNRKVYEKREALCLACDYWEPHALAGLGMCRACGCAKSKLWMATAHCPLRPPKW